MRLSFQNAQFCASNKESSESSMSNKVADKQHLTQTLCDMLEYAVLSFQSQSHTSVKLLR